MFFLFFFFCIGFYFGVHFFFFLHLDFSFLWNILCTYPPPPTPSQDRLYKDDNFYITTLSRVDNFIFLHFFILNLISIFHLFLAAFASSVPQLLKLHKTAQMNKTQIRSVKHKSCTSDILFRSLLGLVPRPVPGPGAVVWLHARRALARVVEGRCLERVVAIVIAAATGSVVAAATDATVRALSELIRLVQHRLLVADHLVQAGLDLGHRHSVDEAGLLGSIWCRRRRGRGRATQGRGRGARCRQIVERLGVEWLALGWTWLAGGRDGGCSCGRAALVVAGDVDDSGGQEPLGAAVGSEAGAGGVVARLVFFFWWAPGGGGGGRCQWNGLRVTKARLLSRAVKTYHER